MSTFSLSNINVPSGELNFGELKSVEDRSGVKVSIPIIIMNGKREGPILLLTACMHADEISSIEAIRRIMREEVTPEMLKGTIVAAPVVNPLAFLAAQKDTPLIVGNADLHTAFPGNENGGINERLAHCIYNQLIKRCDYYVDFHGNWYPAVEFSAQPICEDRKVLEASVAMAQASGLAVCEARAAQGFPTYEAQKLGKPATIIELLAQGYIDKRSVEVGVQAIKNIMNHLGMLEGESKPLPNQKVPPGLYGRGHIFCNHGGLALFQKDAGDRIESGEVVAIVRDLHGNEIEKVKATTEGYIRSIMKGRHSEAVFEGGVIASVLESDPKRKYVFD